MFEAIIGIGSNINPLRNITSAINELAVFSIIEVSPFLYTKPVGYTKQDWFYNGAIAIETCLNLTCLLDKLKAIEKSMGHCNHIKNHPRLIDLDLLIYNGKIFDEDLRKHWFLNQNVKDLDFYTHGFHKDKSYC
jgi:2-amino-4-hydroxy-6-hydroxymethyldihydropteridine diphosphokinase